MEVEGVIDRVRQATVSGKNLINALSGGETAAGAFRVTWLRRLLMAWWWVAAIVTAILFLIDLVTIFGSSSGMQSSRGYGGYGAPGGFDFGNVLFAYARSLGMVNLVCDLWVMAALGFLFQVWRLRVSATEKTVKAWHIVLAVALVFGRWTAFVWGFIYAFFPGWFILWPVKYIVLPPVFLAIAGSLELISLYFAVIMAFAALVWFPVKIFSSVAEVYKGLYISKAASVPFLGQVMSFWYWFTGKQMPQGEEAEPDDTKGARFASLREIAAQIIEARENPKAAIFGYVGQHPLPVYTDKHVLIMASTRSGKGVSLIIPHLLRYTGSAFVLDPKGENAKATGRQRAALNDTVHYLDPFGISGKTQSRFNPLARFTPENMEAESKALAAALVFGERGVRDHWSGSAQQLLAALILHVFTSPGIPRKEKDLPTVRRWLLRDINKAFKEMVQSEVADGLLARLAASFLQTPEKEFGSILSTAQRETEILDNPFIIRCLSASGEGNEVDFSEWHRGTMSVFLCLSAPKFPVFNRWLRLVLTAALDEMTDTLNPPALPVCFMLDELATLGHLDAVENAVGLAAGYGIQLFTVFQDVAQMRDLYKGRWASFIGNAGVRALFNLDDYDTAKYWSNFMGGHLVDTLSQAQDNYGFAKSQTKGEAVRPLLTPEEIMLQFAQGQMLVLSQGSRPIEATRVAYWDDRQLDGLWDDPRQKPEVFDRKPANTTRESRDNDPGRAQKREREAQPPKAPAPAPAEKNEIVQNPASGKVDPPEKAPQKRQEKPVPGNRNDDLFKVRNVLQDKPIKGGKKYR